MEGTERFREVYLATRGQIRSYLARRVEFASVEDLEADVFAVAWRKLGSVRVGEELPWLYRIASYVVANFRRKNQREGALLQKLFSPDSSPAANQVVDSDPELARAWTQLRPAEREVIALVVLDELPVHQAAGILGVSANALSIRLYRAKKHLAELLEHPTHPGSRKNSSHGDM